MSPNDHLGNGTYIFGIKLISKYFFFRKRKYFDNMINFRFKYNNEFNGI
jgi:hypothetical protein